MVKRSWLCNQVQSAALTFDAILPVPFAPLPAPSLLSRHSDTLQDATFLFFHQPCTTFLPLRYCTLQYTIMPIHTVHSCRYNTLRNRSVHFGPILPFPSLPMRFTPFSYAAFNSWQSGTIQYGTLHFAAIPFSPAINLRSFVMSSDSFTYHPLHK